MSDNGADKLLYSSYLGLLLFMLQLRLRIQQAGDTFFNLRIVPCLVPVLNDFDLRGNWSVWQSWHI